MVEIGHVGQSIIVSIWCVAGTVGIILAVVLNSLYKDRNKKAKEWKEKHDKVLSQKKSSEVRLGKIGENLAPFIQDWPYEPGNFRFLGNPVDGISINDDSIVFVEIKTGHSRLSSGQKKAKQLIREGKVRFETFRIGDKGCTLKREEVINLGEANVKNKETA